LIGRLAGPAMAITAVIGLLTAQAAAQRSAVPRDKRSVHWAQAVQARLRRVECIASQHRDQGCQ